MESLKEQVKSFDTETSSELATGCDAGLSENLKGPDAFLTSIDNVSIIGENVVIGGRDLSLDPNKIGPSEYGDTFLDTEIPKNLDSPMPEHEHVQIKNAEEKNITDVQNSETSREEKEESLDEQKPETVKAQKLDARDIKMPESPQKQGQKSPQISDTPKPSENLEKSKRHKFLKLTLTKNKDDVFVRPSPIAEVMSPARMLQFEIDVTTSSTPTMKRAAIDFNFFNENNFEEYFTDVPKNTDGEAKTVEEAYIETPVIVKTDTVRHEIGYVNIAASVICVGGITQAFHSSRVHYSYIAIQFGRIIARSRAICTESSEVNFAHVTVRV
ncbi:hypothetical protein RR48_03512 [Papilio machaon]|uniref:Uncharacterized protein n=1 Tax=Papilio machaon TaxID=76193 RepID=A0A0N1IBC6_PAPMA|nr:hypothetical protein RR48_03512 [Papilio machaon]